MQSVNHLNSKVISKKLNLETDRNVCFQCKFCLAYIPASAISWKLHKETCSGNKEERDNLRLKATKTSHRQRPSRDSYPTSHTGSKSLLRIKPKLEICTMNVKNKKQDEDKKLQSIYVNIGGSLIPVEIANIVGNNDIDLPKPPPVVCTLCSAVVDKESQAAHLLLHGIQPYRPHNENKRDHLLHQLGKNVIMSKVNPTTPRILSSSKQIILEGGQELQKSKPKWKLKPVQSQASSISPIPTNTLQLIPVHFIEDTTTTNNDSNDSVEQIDNNNSEEYVYDISNYENIICEEVIIPAESTVEESIVEMTGSPEQIIVEPELEVEREEEIYTIEVGEDSPVDEEVLIKPVEKKSVKQVAVPLDDLDVEMDRNLNILDALLKGDLSTAKKLVPPMSVRRNAAPTFKKPTTDPRFRINM